MAVSMVKVQGVPTTEAGAWYLIECSACGPYGILCEAEVREFCLAHLKTTHGIEVAEFGPDED